LGRDILRHIAAGMIPLGTDEMAIGIGRRRFISVLGGATVAWPFAARAQQVATPVIGFLHSSSPEPMVNFVAAYRTGLTEAGFVEGQNVAIEFRWAAGQIDRLPELAADLVRRRVAVIATPGSTPAALAAKAATTTIPIVFAIGADPVALGLVASLNKPGGNVTGMNFQNVELQAKALELLRELVPQAVRIVALVNPQSAYTEAVVKNLQEGAASLGLQLEILHASTEGEIEAAFAIISQQPGRALLVGPDPFFTFRRAQIIALAARQALPTMYALREFAEAGGLIAYGPNLTSAYREAGTYTGRILKGEKPADVPVVRPTRFELVINLKTAKVLGFAIPDKLLALADEVIE
jgi:putative ABC transport system substrate-binding protein